MSWATWRPGKRLLWPLPYEALPDKVLPDKVLPDKVLPDKVLPYHNSHNTSPPSLRCRASRSLITPRLVLII